MRKKEKCAKKKSGAGKFLLGAAVGAGLGILFAPKAGSETRRDLKNKIDELLKKVKEIDVDDVKEQLQLKIEEIRYELSNLDKEKVLKIAKEKGNDLKQRCEELVQLAIDKGTPVLQKAANEVREKTIDAIKEILEKLEEADRKAKEK
ncbi:MAG: YtxH domain-containing protein [bacterium]|nr:YtxH domain-containing protein [bacterium]